MLAFALAHFDQMVERGFEARSHRRARRVQPQSLPPEVASPGRLQNRIDSDLTGCAQLFCNARMAS